MFAPAISIKLKSRSAVEDTRLEAKDRKKPRPRPRTALPRTGQTLSRPKTGMLEAKDQVHKRKCSPKKWSLQKFFKRSQTKKKVLQKIFQALRKILTIHKIHKILLSLVKASRPRISKCVLEESTSVENLL